MTYAGVSAGGGTSGLTKITGTTLAVSAWQVDFTSIPSTYAALLLIANIRSGTGSNTDILTLQFNTVTTSSYYTVANKLIANAVTSTTSNASTSMPVGVVPGYNSSPAMGSLAIWLPGYAHTSNHKSVFGEGSMLATSTTTNWVPGTYSGQWSSAAAINAITLITQSGNMIRETSSMTLYGLA